jgi:nucleoside 2-deoxyribosyltransferase
VIGSKRALLRAMAAICVAPLMVGTRRASARARPRNRRKATSMKIYLAGPLGFSEAGRSFHANIIVPTIRRLGHDVLDPWALTPASETIALQNMPYGAARRDAWRELNRKIGDRNRAAIDDCHMVFAVLDGVDVDSGTAAEIGYAFAKGKPILGYRGDFRLSADNEGAAVNLQVEYFIEQSGGTIIAHIGELEGALAKFKRDTK